MGVGTGNASSIEKILAGRANGDATRFFAEFFTQKFRFFIDSLTGKKLAAQSLHALFTNNEYLPFRITRRSTFQTNSPQTQPRHPGTDNAAGIAFLNAASEWAFAANAETV